MVSVLPFYGYQKLGREISPWLQNGSMTLARLTACMVITGSLLSFINSDAPGRREPGASGGCLSCYFRFVIA